MLKHRISDEAKHHGGRNILHVVDDLDKFIPPFIDFVERHIEGFDRHIFFIMGDDSRYPVRARPNTRFAREHSKYGKWISLAREMNRAEKIILHGLFNPRIVKLLMLQPWVLKKCYWLMWGGDLYYHELGERGFGWHKNEFFRRFVIKRVGRLVTYIKGDYELAQKWYGAKGEYQECLMYPSNIYHELDVPPKTGNTINILVGNSADPSNNHLDIFQKLLPYLNQDIRIYCPLSYGDPAHAQCTAAQGIELFGDKFVPLIEYMPFDEYKKLLGQIDIAVFAHKRQQGMGNTISLLGLGKKVYMRSDVTPRKTFSKLGVQVNDFEYLDLRLIEPGIAKANQDTIRTHFSGQALIKQLAAMFKD